MSHAGKMAHGEGDSPTLWSDRLAIVESWVGAATFTCFVPGLLTKSKTRLMLRACKPILPICFADTVSR